MYDNLNDKKRRQELMVQYRDVFLKTQKGRALITHMFAELGLFEESMVDDHTAKTERELGRYDYAVHLLEIMGIRQYANLHNFVKASAKWPVEYPKKKVEEEENG